MFWERGNGWVLGGLVEILQALPWYEPSRAFYKQLFIELATRVATLQSPDGSYTSRGEDVIRQTPFGRMGKPEELCGTIHYLMSDAARFVTGTVAVVDGGFNAFVM